MQEISEEILEKAKKGDLVAFHKIYQVSSGFVYSVALRMIHNTADAEEITQDVFIGAHKHLKKFEGRASLKTWLYRMTINTAINYGKKKTALRKKHEKAETHQERNFSTNEAVTQLEQEEKERTLKKILRCLTEDQKACIILREIEGLDYKEIAKTLKINLNTVRSRIKRAREAMITQARKEGL